MPVEELLAAFENYVSNNVPIHILDVRSIQVTSDINDVTLLTREDIRRISRPKIEALQEADILADKALLGCEEWEDWHKGDLTPLIQRHIKYAIFSHRWSSTGEPSFNDVSQRNDSSGDGWTKLLNFCKKAKEYGCDYAWSDTCCINKTSSAELEEAIRSMYRWYSSAEICIAYLERSSNVKDFGTEPWFTRGWTLQELLAPRKTKFYGKEWNPILPHVPLESNDKEQHDISSAIEQTTRIPQHQLISFRPGCYRVWEKLLWASRRTTTRAEDMAYCLIGMLDISMSIAYGEGDWAFHRLMETILQRCDEPEIFAWVGQPSPYSLVLPSSPACYGAIWDSQMARELGLQPSKGRQVLPAWSSNIGDRTFTLTKHGLEIELLIIEAEMVAIDESISLGDAWLTLRLTWNLPGSTSTRETVRVHTDVRRLYLEPRWALGVINYEKAAAAGRGQLRAGVSYLCFLLGSPYNPTRWTKFYTRNPLILHCEHEVEEPLRRVYLQQRSATQEYLPWLKTVAVRD
ncbi:hypothetical protein V8B97DRAFT_1387593 [Scleroderma yunnanense]